MKVLFASRVERPQDWLSLLERALPHDCFVSSIDAAIDIALVAAPPPGTLERLGTAKLIQSLWMGVETLLADPALPRQVPLARMVDPGMVAAMSETVIAHVLDWHRHFYSYRAFQSERRWKRRRQYLASDRTIGFLGMGELGRDAAAKLVALGFRVAGWSRRPKHLAGIESYDGEEGLERMLARCDVVVCLLPLTAQTKGILDFEKLKKMKQGGAVINLARGGHIVTAELLAALDSGHLSRAYLDVFETEPLPAESPLWTHPSVIVTPHIAALTEPRTAVPVIVENVERVRRGETPAHLVDREAGY